MTKSYNQAVTSRGIVYRWGDMWWHVRNRLASASLRSGKYNHDKKISQLGQQFDMQQIAYSRVTRTKSHRLHVPRSHQNKQKEKRNNLKARIFIVTIAATSVQCLSRTI